MYSGVSKGLRFMFFAVIASLIGTFLGAVLYSIPTFAVIFMLIVVLVCSVFSMIGIYKISDSLIEAKPAFKIAIARIVVILLGDFFLTNIFSMLDIVLFAAETYFIVKVTAKELAKNGNAVMERRGSIVWKLCLVSSTFDISVYVLGLLGLYGNYLLVINLLSKIVGLVMGILYLVYLYSAAGAFDELEDNITSEPEQE